MTFAPSMPAVARRRSVTPAAGAPPRANGIRVDWRPLASLTADSAPAWRDLAQRTIQPNVFLEPTFALSGAGLPYADGVGALRLFSDARLVGLILGRVERIAHGRLAPTFVAWTHPYSPRSGVLIDAGAAEPALKALLATLPRLPGAPELALFPLLDEQGLFARMLADHLYRAAKRPGRIEPHARAALVPSRGDPLAAVSAKKLKELRRQQRRLAELGTIAHRIAKERRAIEAAIAAYLTIEASGWKARNGGAAKLDPAAQRFLVEAVSGLASEGKARIDLLTFGDRAIAATITLFSGDQAWFWKTAYDEEFSRFSPGVQLAVALTRSLAADRRITLVDSCAIADHPMIDHLWAGRMAVADWLVPLTRTAPVTLASAAERLGRLPRRIVTALRSR